ncbi:hypothetical protein B9G98_04265 [Wickerhamiella sorbophila]|uniref:Uncharacterized protein n=1 Tax=Wickerhamiella sorbophila TaxID=45607 RepID=A0A2T0FNT9_9ASCO|nr:hypothetical protein B9G98_04265 [Wickerhamiella sorbophila]PRT56645.1 hypothetical protein B9G98_04265 [Wickerhamiella sorbophila]
MYTETVSRKIEDATIAYMLYISEIREQVRRDVLENPFSLLAKACGPDHDENIVYSAERVLSHEKSAELMWDHYVRSYILQELKEWESTHWFYHASFENGQTEIPQDDDFFRTVGLICKKYFDLEIVSHILDLNLPYAKAQTPQKLKHGETTSAWAQAICLSRILVGYARRGSIDAHLVGRVMSKITSLLTTGFILPDNVDDLTEIQWALSLGYCVQQREVCKL